MKQSKKQQIEDQEAREIWKELPEHKKEKFFGFLDTVVFKLWLTGVVKIM